MQNNFHSLPINDMPVVLPNTEKEVQQQRVNHHKVTPKDKMGLIVAMLLILFLDCLERLKVM
jgi:hypothetical protein